MGFLNKKNLFLYLSGVILPVWNPQNPSVGDKVARAIVYFVALIYMFLGMSIIADRFMSSIEVCEPFVGIYKDGGKRG